VPRDESASDGPLPLRRTYGVRRRKRSGVAALLVAAASRAVMVVALPVAVVVWLLYSPYFLIHEVKVDGGARVSSAWMQENLAPLVGRHVLAVSLESVRRRLSDHPWVASVELRRELPDRIRVSVVERVPVALLAGREGLSFLDGEGNVIAPFDESLARQGSSRLLVVRYPLREKYLQDGGNPVAAPPVPVQPALDLVAELRRAHPGWGVGVEEVEVLGEGEYRVKTAALAYPLLLEAGTVAPAVVNFERMLPEIVGRVREIGEADLRSPRRLVIRPAAPAKGVAEGNGSRTQEG
jgi:POTRA domain-containing FtsQ-type protein